MGRVIVTWLSSLVITLAMTATVVADGDDAPDRSPWIDQGGSVPLPTSTASIPDPATAAAGLSADPDAGVTATTERPSRLRRYGSLAGVIGVYAAATTYMYFAWYHGQPNLPEFTVGGDGYFGRDTYAGGADKVGHAWANTMWSRLTAEILLWGGWERWKAGLIAPAMTAGLFTLVEVKDGFYYEFSPGDAIANVLGAGLTAAMVNFPRLDELIDFRVEYYPSRQYLDLLAGKRPPGEDPTMPRQISLNFAEDYSGQRYLLALHLGGLPGLRGQTWARLVDVAVGYETKGYKPDPIETDVERERHLFLGVSVNLQGVIDLALGGRRSRPARVGHTVGHIVTEFFNPPFGSAAIVGPRSVAPPD
jgi:hypothetical protein